MNLADSDMGVDVGWNGGCGVGGCQPLMTTVLSPLSAAVLTPGSTIKTSCDGSMTVGWLVEGLMSHVTHYRSHQRWS